MEPETIFYIALFAYWLISQILTIANKGEARVPGLRGAPRYLRRRP